MAFVKFVAIPVAIAVAPEIERCDVRTRCRTLIVIATSLTSHCSIIIIISDSR